MIKIYTLLDKETVDSIIASHEQAPHLRSLQKRLAHEVALLVHGEARAESVERVTHVLFGGGLVTELQDDDVNALAEEIPVLETGLRVSEALVRAALCTSAGEARRLMAGGGVS